MLAIDRVTVALVYCQEQCFLAIGVGLNLSTEPHVLSDIQRPVSPAQPQQLFIAQTHWDQSVRRTATLRPNTR